MCNIPVKQQMYLYALNRDLEIERVLERYSDLPSKVMETRQ